MTAIVDTVEFEREEQQMHRRIGQPLGNVAVEFGDRGIDAVAGMNQAGIGAQTPGEVLDCLIAPDRLGEPLAAILLGCVLRKLARVVRLKGDAFRVQPCEVARDLRRVDTGIEIGQVPFRKFGRSRFAGCFWRFALPLAAPLLDAGLDVSLAREIADLVVMNAFKMGGDQAKAASCGASSTSSSSLPSSSGSTLS